METICWTGEPTRADAFTNNRGVQPRPRKKDPVSKVYVDCGIDFTQSQIDKIAGQHSKYGFQSIQVRNGRLRVLAHAEGARLRFGISPDNSPQVTPLVRGGDNPGDDPFDYRTLQGAMEALDLPCRLEGHIDYTIDREWIELRASPMELVYGDNSTIFRMRADQGEIRLPTSSGEIEMSFVGKVEIALGDWRATAHSMSPSSWSTTNRRNVARFTR